MTLRRVILLVCLSLVLALPACAAVDRKNAAVLTICAGGLAADIAAWVAGGSSFGFGQLACGLVETAAEAAPEAESAPPPVAREESGR